MIADSAYGTGHRKSLHVQSRGTRLSSVFTCMSRRERRSTLFPYTTLFRSRNRLCASWPTTPPRPRSLPSSADDGKLRRSEEHTTELQSRGHLVCRLLPKKKQKTKERR